jgi:hypothetical protein
LVFKQYTRLSTASDCQLKMSAKRCPPNVEYPKV